MKNKRSGFTLMEVVIVLAVIAILGAVIVPSFMGYTERARLRTDIQSARTVQNAMDLYKAEVGRDVASDITSSSTGNTAEEKIINHLTGAGYLDGSPRLQTSEAVWEYIDATKKMCINIADCTSSFIRNMQFSEQERPFVIN